MEDFEFYNPVKIIFAPGEIAKVGVEAAKLGKKVLLVSYKEHDFFSDLLDKIQSMLEVERLEVIQFFEVTATPRIGQVPNGVNVCKGEGVDIVIGVGGGSAMDAAKMIAAGFFYKGDLWNMVVSRHDITAVVPPEKALPVLMVPTLPATGSEWMVSTGGGLDPNALTRSCSISPS